MKKLIFTIIFAFSFIFLNSISAQSYSSAVGVKLGYCLNGTFKKQIKENFYVDIYAGFRTHFILGGAAVEFHKPIEEVENLYWYYGGGAYFGSYNYNSFSYTFIGINGVLGLDYSFDEIPLNVSVDWMPGFNLTGDNNGFYSYVGGLSVRYILGDN